MTLTDLQARNIATAVWEELASRKGLDIQELVDNSDKALLADIHAGLVDAAQSACKRTEPLELPWGEDSDDD